MSAAQDNRLGTYLKDRRAKLDPTAFGIPLTRRRTPGLRREEVAQRANVSATWYTWLEQGRGGAPSSDVLDRISRAMMLTDAEREHLFLLGLGRSPGGPLSAILKLRHTAIAARARHAGTQPRFCQNGDVGRRGLESRRDRRADRLCGPGGLAAQYPAPHFPRLARARRATGLGERRAVRGGGVPRGRGARRCGEECRGPGRGTQPHQPRIRGDVARQRCAASRMATARKSCIIPSPGRSGWSIRPLPSMAGPISAW